MSSQHHLDPSKPPGKARDNLNANLWHVKIHQPSLSVKQKWKINDLQRSMVIFWTLQYLKTLLFFFGFYSGNEIPMHVCMCLLLFECSYLMLDDFINKVLHILVFCYNIDSDDSQFSAWQETTITKQALQTITTFKTQKCLNIYHELCLG